MAQKMKECFMYPKLLAICILMLVGVFAGGQEIKNLAVRDLSGILRMKLAWTSEKFRGGVVLELADEAGAPVQTFHLTKRITGAGLALQGNSLLNLKPYPEMNELTLIFSGARYGLLQVNGTPRVSWNGDCSKVRQIRLKSDNAKAEVADFQWEENPKQGIAAVFGKEDMGKILPLGKTLKGRYEVNFRIRPEFEKGQSWFEFMMKPDGIEANIRFKRDEIALWRGPSGYGGSSCRNDSDQWHNVRILADGDYLEYFLDGSRIGYTQSEYWKENVPFGLKTFHCGLEMTDFNICALPPLPRRETTREPVFFFEGVKDMNARNAAGKVIVPLTAKDVQVSADGARAKTGMEKQAVLTFPCKGVFKDSGTILFWMKPDWNGNDNDGMTTDPMKSFGLLNLSDEAGQRLMSWWVWYWFRADVRLNTGKMFVFDKRSARQAVEGDNWLLCTFLWDQNGWSGQVFDAQDRADKLQRVSGLDLMKAATLSIRSLDNGSLRGLKIYDRALSGEELEREYRTVYPFEYHVNRGMFVPGKCGPEMDLAPLGYFSDFETKPEKESSANFSLALCSMDGKVLTSKNFGMVSLTAPKTFRLPEITLEKGVYRLKAIFGKNGTSTEVSSRIRVEPLSLTTGGKEELRLGETIYERRLNALDKDIIFNGNPRWTGKALEAGSTKGNRYSFEVPIPEKWKGKWVAVDIEWPDDQPRSMALYMFAPHGGASDNMGGGISAGAEYPNTGRIQTTRYFLYAASPIYLFELRTMVTGQPAAISAIRIRGLADNRFPTLKIRSPEGFEGRMLGHFDEDQSFTWNFGMEDYSWHIPTEKLNGVTARPLERLLSYFAYTGENAFSWPMFRYSESQIPLSRLPQSPYFPNTLKEYPYLIEQMGAHDVHFFAGVNLGEVPETAILYAKATEFAKTGVHGRNKNGELKKCSPAHPQNLEWLCSNIEQMLRRYGNCRGFSGVDMGSLYTLNFGSMDNGYDDYTIERFRKETGCKVPEFTGMKYAERHAYLTSSEHRDLWLRWRADLITKNIRTLREAMDKFAPQVPLYIECSPNDAINTRSTTAGINWEKFFYEEKGLDMNALRRIPNVYPCVFLTGNKYRQKKHWNMEETAWDELFYDPEIAKVMRNGVQNRAIIWYAYFETYMKTQMPEKYKQYFQSFNMMPAGRYALKPLAHLVARYDADCITHGGQKLASLGHETEIREFAKAFRALPRKPFEDVRGSNDPVTVRQFHGNGKTYFYMVNRTHADPVTVSLVAEGGTEAEDLSSGEKQPVVNSLLKFELKPFQLRSFIINGKVNIAVKEVSVPTDFVKSLEAELAVLEKGNRELEEQKLDDPAVSKRLRLIRHLLEQKQYAEAFRLLWSPLCQNLTKRIDAMDKGYLRKERAMIDNGVFAVNCGSKEYWTAPDGKLFFPDRAYDPSEKYGYTGTWQSVGRELESLPKDTRYRKLYETESYNIETYRFNAKPLTDYKMIVYQRAGFQDSRKPGAILLELLLNGKVIRPKYDLFESMGKQDCAVFEFPFRTGPDGVVELTVRVGEENIHLTARLLNAVELIPTKGEKK